MLKQSETMEAKIKRLIDLSKLDSLHWTSDQYNDYEDLSIATGISIGLDGKLYNR